jgi:hypothetical protein
MITVVAARLAGSREPQSRLQVVRKVWMVTLDNEIREGVLHTLFIFVNSVDLQFAGWIRRCRIVAGKAHPVITRPG